MFFRRNPNVIYRDFGDFGYITDNRNFSYKKNNSNSGILGDKILSATGSKFFSKLSIFLRHIDEIVNDISKLYPEVDINVIKNDAINFYYNLEKDKFVFSSSSDNIEQNCQLAKSLITDCSDEIKKTTSKFFDEYFNGHPYITNVHIDIISKCNEHCLHCYIPHSKKNTEMESDLFDKILQQCNDLNVLHLTLSGGEPLLHHNFLNFLNQIIEYNYSVNILTNLVLFNDDFFDLIKNNPLVGIQTSLYSMDSTIHDKITGLKGSFEKTKRAILKLNDAGVAIQISCPILKQNKNSYYSVVEWGEKYKIPVGDDLLLIGTYNYSKENLKYRLSLDEAREVVKNKLIHDKEYANRIYLNSEKKKNFSPDDPVCNICNSSICISENGDVYPCAGWRGCVIDNINRTALKDIWYNAQKVKLLRDIRKRSFQKCLECSDQNYCTMCMVRNANESSSGDYLDVNKYYCSIVRIYKELINEANT